MKTKLPTCRLPDDLITCLAWRHEHCVYRSATNVRADSSGYCSMELPCGSAGGASGAKGGTSGGMGARGGAAASVAEGCSSERAAGVGTASASGNVPSRSGTEAGCSPSGANSDSSVPPANGGDRRPAAGDLCVAAAGAG